MIAKRMLLFATAALAIIAVAVPSAQAEWTHEGKPLKGASTFALSGSVKLEQGAGNSFECAVLIGMTILEGAEGKGSLNSFEPAAATCKGAGTVAGCELESSSSENLPWVVDAKEWPNKVIDAKATNVEFEYKFKKGCAVPSAHVVFPEVTMTPDNVNQISSFTLSGAEGGGVNAKISGTVFLTSKAKTYGIK